MDHHPIDKALGLRPMEEALKDEENNSTVEELTPETLPAEVGDNTNEVANVEPVSDETLDDIERARRNIQNIIDQGDDSLQFLIDLAKQSESPRAYEVVSNMMKTLLDANQDFVDMAMKKKYHKEELEGPKEEVSQTNITNNNLILSTNELLDMLMDKENKDD